MKVSEYLASLNEKKFQKKKTKHAHPKQKLTWSEMYLHQAITETLQRQQSGALRVQPTKRVMLAEGTEINFIP